MIHAKKTNKKILWLIMLGIILNIVMNIPLINIWGKYKMTALGSLILSEFRGLVQFINICHQYYYIDWELKKYLFNSIFYFFI